MPKINDLVLSKKLKNIDPALLFRFITAANKEYIELLKKSIPDIEKSVIYKPILLSELRRKIHLLLATHQQLEAHKLLKRATELVPGSSMESA